MLFYMIIEKVLTYGRREREREIVMPKINM